MKRVIWSVCGFAALLIASTPAFAQQARKIAITATAPSGIGILWHVSDKVALRPEFNFSRTSTESSGTGVTAGTTTSWSVGSGGSVLFFTGKWDNLRAYVSPRFTFARSTTSSSTGASSSTNPTAYAVTGSAGAQYGLSDRFAVFGEVGLGYGWQSSTYSSSLPPTYTIKSRSFGTSSRIGVAIYF